MPHYCFECDSEYVGCYQCGEGKFCNNPQCGESGNRLDVGEAGILLEDDDFPDFLWDDEDKPVFCSVGCKDKWKVSGPKPKLAIIEASEAEGMIKLTATDYSTKAHLVGTGGDLANLQKSINVMRMELKAGGYTHACFSVNGGSFILPDGSISKNYDLDHPFVVQEQLAINGVVVNIMKKRTTD
jgi:hypothetical protein